MASQILIQQPERRPQVAPQAGLPTGVALAPFPPEGAAAWEEPEEVLVADPRGGLTPAQMVDQKLRGLLQTANPGLFLLAAGRPHDLRRTTR